jgi:hypothetical protein
MEIGGAEQNLRHVRTQLNCPHHASAAGFGLTGIQQRFAQVAPAVWRCRIAAEGALKQRVGSGGACG